MKRALQLSLLGGTRVSPNPFVGAVIVARDRIIGEGFHRQFGEAHAEVNAVASVNDADKVLLKESTMYVTLEPCSHFGKTPPCADLVISCGIPHVVIAAEDPFLKDYESGIEKMRNAGIEVETGLMRREAHWINRRFFTAHTMKRPFILLKWAMSSDGFMAGEEGRTVTISNPFTQLLVHRERAMYDAIMVGTNTILCDNPRLDCRRWPARLPDKRPLKVTFDSKSLTGSSRLEHGELIKKTPDESLESFMHRLYSEYEITSMMVEGGRKTLELFLGKGLFDEIRIETSPMLIKKGIEAPDPIPAVKAKGMRELIPETHCGNTIRIFVKNY